MLFLLPLPPAPFCPNNTPCRYLNNYYVCFIRLIRSLYQALVGCVGSQALHEIYIHLTDWAHVNLLWDLVVFSTSFDSIMCLLVCARIWLAFTGVLIVFTTILLGCTRVVLGLLLFWVLVGFSQDLTSLAVRRISTDTSAAKSAWWAAAA